MDRKWETKLDSLHTTTKCTKQLDFKQIEFVDTRQVRDDWDNIGIPA